MYMEGNKSLKTIPVLDDQKRFPALDDFRFLNHLRQHPFAPRYNFRSGDRLTPKDIQEIGEYRKKLSKEPKHWKGDELPQWLQGYLATCRTQVPFYRNFPENLLEMPTTRRKDIQKEPWFFVSDTSKLQDLLVYSTSGTTGPPMDVNFDAVTQGTYLAQLQEVLAGYGIRITGGSKRVSITLICDQEETLTYASLSTYLDSAGILKINLNPNEWQEPDHRIRYLEELNSEILTGDPLAFHSLMLLPVQLTPKALISSALKLLPGTKNKLEDHFGCPVIDLYSLTECRMIAASWKEHLRLIRHDLFLETLYPNRDIQVPEGERGELTITGGNNPFLRLIRYRTGDSCTLEYLDDAVIIKNLEGRAPVCFYDFRRQFVNSIDISRSLSRFNLPGYTLHQNQDHSLFLTIFGADGPKNALSSSLKSLFGKKVPVTIISEEAQQTDRRKQPSYSSDFESRYGS